MNKLKKEYSSLAEFISSKREEQNLSQEDLSEKSSLTIEQIQSIEQGLELFLPSTSSIRIKHVSIIHRLLIKSSVY